MSESPLAPVGDGQRGPGGRFRPGNKLAKGNPYARRVARLRTALLKAVNPGDVEAVATALLTAAKAGDVAAARELLNRVLGPPVEHDLIERLERLEQSLSERAKP